MTVIEVTARPVLLLGWDPSREVEPAGVAGAVTFGTAQVNVTVLPTGVAGSATVGTPDVSSNLTVVSLTGIASSATVGQPQVNVVVTAPSVAGTGSAGSPTVRVSVQPTGINAGTGSAGAPSVSTVLRPASIVTAGSVGTVTVDNSVAVSPVGIGSFSLFGQVQVTNRRIVFRNPRNTYQWRVPPLKEYEGISLLRENGVWSEVAHPDLERTLNAEVYLGGGRDHILSADLRAELAALGYPSIEEIVP